MIHHIILLLVGFIGFENAECFEIHELSSHCIDLFIRVSTQFTNKKTDTGSGNSVFDDEFFEKLHARTRSKEFGKIHEFLDRKGILELKYMGKERKCKHFIFDTILPS